MTTSLRDELGAKQPAAPPFSVLLPRGWISQDASADALDALRSKVSDVFRRNHRPDLDSRFSSVWEPATRELLRRDPVRIMYPYDAPEEELFPLSIVAVRVTDPTGLSLDRRVGELVRKHDARPMDDAARMLRWHADDRLSVDGGVATVRSFNYLVAIPGTERRQALMFTGVLPTSAGESLDQDTIDGAQLLMDAIMSTFTWDAP